MRSFWPGGAAVADRAEHLRAGEHQLDRSLQQTGRGDREDLRPVQDGLRSKPPPRKGERIRTVSGGTPNQTA